MAIFLSQAPATFRGNFSRSTANELLLLQPATRVTPRTNQAIFLTHPCGNPPKINPLLK